MESSAARTAPDPFGQLANLWWFWLISTLFHGVGDLIRAFQIRKLRARR
jgi:hypothetical protein